MGFGLFSLVALIFSTVYQLVLIWLLKMMGPNAGLLGALFFVLAIVVPFGLVMAIGRRARTWGGGPDGTKGLWLAILISVAATFVGIQLTIIFVMAVFGM